MVLLHGPRGDSVLQRVTVGARVGAHLRVGALDRALAGGAVPESEVALTLHARRLISPKMRRRLALLLRRIVESSRRTARPPTRRPGHQVAQASADLLVLAERLECPEPVDARGVAQVRVLLGDGGGPLHANRNADDLVEAAREAVAALDPGDDKAKR